MSRSPIGSHVLQTRPGSFLPGCLAVVLLAMAAPALAVPLTVAFQDMPQCDPLVPLSPFQQPHELGVAPAFSLFPGELISASDVITATSACPAFDTAALNLEVSITNLTGLTWTDLWYVHDGGTLLSNIDGKINGMDAFRIDAVGVNTPLQSESLTSNGRFEPNETWKFVIDDYFNPAGLAASALASIGVPSGGGLSSGSIVAVAEPGTLMLLGIGLAVLSLAGRRQKTR